MNRRRFVCGAMAASVMAAGARADSPAEAISGDAFFWNGAEARLIDVLAPITAPDMRQPYAEEARRALQNVLTSGALFLEDAPATDRWGRRVVRAYVEKEGGSRRSVQAALVGAGAVGSFNIVQGEVLNAASGRGRIYLNFGADFREDFTVTAKSLLARKWKKEGPDLLALGGTRLRARGHVAWINGPSIELTHPRQLEIV